MNTKPMKRHHLLYSLCLAAAFATSISEGQTTGSTTAQQQYMQQERQYLPTRLGRVKPTSESIDTQISTSTSCDNDQCTIKICKSGVCKTIVEPAGVSTSTSTSCSDGVCQTKLCVNGKCSILS